MEPMILAAPAEEIAKALPAARSLLTSGSDRQKVVAVGVLFNAVRRPDGTALVMPYLPDVLAALRDPTRGQAMFANYILSWLFPQPRSVVVPYLVQYLGDEHVSEEMRGGVIWTLLMYTAADDPAAVSAIATFMKAKHSRDVRERAIQGLGLVLGQPYRYNAELVELVIDAIRNDSGVRRQAIEALGRCGWKAFTQANPVLSTIADDDRETGEIRAAAKEALDEIVHSPRY